MANVDERSCFFKNQNPEVECNNDYVSLREPYEITYDNNMDYGCQLECMLLRSGYFDLQPTNLLEFDICLKHYDFLTTTTTTRRYNCNICKLVFDPNKTSSTTGLRKVSKLIAVGLWSDHHLSTYDKTICTTCRLKLEKKYKNNENHMKCRKLFEWLYNPMIIFTPEKTTSVCDESYCHSDTSSIKKEKKESFTDWFRSQGFNGRIERTESYCNLQQHSQINFLHQLKLIILFIIGLLAPNDVETVWNDFIERENEILNDNNTDDCQVIMMALADAYSNAQHWSTKRQLLSIIAADIPFRTAKQYIPDLSLWRFNEARRQAKINGRGSILQIERSPTCRFTINQVNHFIEYILSPHITTDLPFGNKKIKMSTGETIEIPNHIRNIIPSRIILQYYQFCKENCPNTFKPLSESVLYQILDGCSASTRKSLQGLDYFAADGSTAFDNLLKISDELLMIGVADNVIRKVKLDLQSSRNYLKNDYKLHISDNSTVPDHCSVFALSDLHEKEWYQTCNHHHNDRCEKCSLLDNTFHVLKSLINNCTDNIPSDKLKRLLYRAEHNINLIYDWKAHILRTVHQEGARSEVLKSLDSKSVFIQVDWAMKFLAKEYRESQRQWFAKRGLSWHVCYVIKLQTSSSFSYTTKKNNFSHRTFIHVFDHCVQNGQTVTSIIKDVFTRIKSTNPEIGYAFIRSDNAGCYHGCEFALSVKKLHQETGIFLRRIDFSDPQSGKSNCDRMAAVIKCNIRRYIDEKHNVTNSKEFILAARETKFLSSYASVISRDGTESKKKIQWSGIKSFNNIEYVKRTTSKPTQNIDELEGIDVKCWRAWNIGNGKVFKWEQLEQITSIAKLNVIDEFSITNNQWLMEPDENESVVSNPNAQSDENVPKKHPDVAGLSGFEVFDCPEEGCTKQFIKHGQLLNHLSTGKHTIHKENMSLLDTAKSLYQNKLQDSSTRQIPSLKDFIVIRSNNVQEKKLLPGWALLQQKTKSPLTKEQKQFLEDKYNQGEEQNMKFNAVDVAQEMETLMHGNEYVFEPYQWLKSTQIQSFWSRLTKNRRRSSQKRATTDETVTSNDDIDDQEEEDELFEKLADDVKQKLLREQKQKVHENKNDSSVSLVIPTPSMKTKQSQRSMDNLAEQQKQKKRSMRQ